MSLNYNDLNSEARLLPDSTWQKSLILHKSLSSKCLSLNQHVSGNPRLRRFLTNTEHLEINGAFHRKQRRTGLKRWIFAAWSFSYPTITATFPDATHKWSCRRKFQLHVKVCPEMLCGHECPLWSLSSNPTKNCFPRQPLPLFEEQL